MGYTVTRRYGDTIETYQYEKNLAPKRKRRPDSYEKRNGRVATRSASSVQRARRAFTRLVRANLGGDENPTLFTFTMLEVLSFEASSRIFSLFSAALRKRYGQKVRYIAVPEFQTRGALHWHALYWGLPRGFGCLGHYDRKRHKFIHQCPIGRQCERRTRDIQRLWLRGFVDGRETDGHAKLAGYLAKYMSKAMSDKRLVHKRAYNVSRNCLRPMQAGSHSLHEYFDELIPDDAQLLTVKKNRTQWLGNVIYKQYKI